MKEIDFFRGNNLICCKLRVLHEVLAILRLHVLRVVYDLMKDGATAGALP